MIAPIEIGTIIAAVIAAICSIISIVYARKGSKENIRSNQELSKQVQEAENKRNEAQIDANITWNARVEWIQNVRRITAEFITTSYKYLHSNPDDENEKFRNLELVHEKKSLLILYFGPDDIDTNRNKAKDICDINTNNAKNKMIVDLINELFNQLSTYFVNEHEYKRSHTEIIKCLACENAETGKKIICEKNEYEGAKELFVEDDCILFQKRQKEIEEACLKRRKELFNNINMLTEALRIYLKIEWNYTKNRKK